MVLLVGDEMNRYESVSRDDRKGLVMHEGDFCWCLYCHLLLQIEAVWSEQDDYLTLVCSLFSH
ncbi:hypothetical protein CF120_14575 [Aeromonas allosaccharophila]|nr:hypothetical protein CF120_14575 [Aeromonas allosaccharophila]